MVSTSRVGEVINLRGLSSMSGRHFKPDAGVPLPEIGARVKISTSHKHRQWPIEGTFDGLWDQAFFLRIKQTSGEQVNLNAYDDQIVTMEILE